MRITFALVLICLLQPCQAADRLLIHEWGTFTSLQDEDGNAIGGINSDDEALPPFVHDLIQTELAKANPFSKGIPGAFPTVTMRLETPVLYFHPAASAAALPPIDVSAEFHGGLLTQFYPNAFAPPPSIAGGQLKPITNETVGTLKWNSLTVGSDGVGPKTDSHVWTAPRDVNAANVRDKSGETERFLFYRGVGHLDAPIRAVQHGSSIELHGQSDLVAKDFPDLRAAGAWFCQFRDDGSCAWKPLGAMDLASDSGRALATVTPFEAADFKAENLTGLKSAMHAALVADGLFNDEATAMLSTWELSYFKSAGTRLFFLVPRAWTDHHLPLHVSVDADINRVMVGRIDLVMPELREALRRFTNMDPKADPAAYNAAYGRLGRFREALLMDEQRRHSPTNAAARISP